MKIFSRKGNPEPTPETPATSDEVRRAIAQAAFDIDCGRARPRSQKREEREIFADGYWQPARRSINLGRPW